MMCSLRQEGLGQAQPFEIDMSKKIEQEPDEKEKRSMSLYWHNKLLVDEMTEEERRQMTLVLNRVDDFEEQDREIKRQLKVRESTQQNKEHWAKMTWDERH